MDAIGNQAIRTPAAVIPPDEISAEALLDILARHPANRLVFNVDGRPLQRGYHVTEVKAGRFDALDCGANPESWTELFVQLWDVDDSDQPMTAGKFAAIIRKVTRHVSLDLSARLTFEVSDGVAPMQLHKGASPAVGADCITVELSPRPASCKPRDRWLAETQRASCCGGTQGTTC